MTLTSVQREFLFCASAFWIVPALARSGAGVDRLLPGGDRSCGGPIEDCWVAEKNGWGPVGDGPARRYRIWGAQGSTLTMQSSAFGDVLVTVTRQQLRAYARSLPYPVVADLRALGEPTLPRAADVDRVLEVALNLTPAAEPRELTLW
ncbi:hypothetical protein DEU38_103154 [Rhodococcus sp. AG1013]|uniref:hypothetical protein n=1 Tax=Rhodococcus sp. AG1013 TaxID=2183996 RepID=UPI000E0AB57D|nr:hypothetical protein [Rhodococcus sp. AG1013]RDI32421.1 hypothetical protein DEU38_103154 [Rhodococcus sp. AG1013]